MEDNRLYWWVPAYDPELARYSPGRLLSENLLADSFARGHAEFDFLVGGNITSGITRRITEKSARWASPPWPFLCAMSDDAHQAECELFMLIPIGIFLLSMEDYYFPAISGAPLPVVGAAFIWFSCQSFRQARPPEIILASFILLGVVVGFCRVLADPSVEIWPSNFVGWLVGFIILMTDFSGRKAQIDRGIYLFLVIHVGFFFLQSFTYMVFHYYIDPVSWITGESSRYQEQDLREIALVVPIRPTGMFLEPSNYAVHILPIVLVYYIQRGRISLLIAASLASVALTYSSWAFFAVATSFLLFISRKASNLIIIGVVAVFLTLSANWFMVRTFETQYDTDRDTPAEFRLIFAENVLEGAANFSPGLGIGVRDAGLGEFAEYTINDSGAAIYFVYVFGLSALVVLIALIWGARGWRNKILLALILSSKLTPTYPFFWLLMNMSMRNAPNRDARECQDLTPPRVMEKPRGVR